MHEFELITKFRVVFKFFFNEILDSLYVVISCSLDLLDALCVGY